MTNCITFKAYYHIKVDNVELPNKTYKKITAKFVL